jgi:hypothetical protein
MATLLWTLEVQAEIIVPDTMAPDEMADHLRAILATWEQQARQTLEQLTTPVDFHWRFERALDTVRDAGAIAETTYANT